MKILKYVLVLIVIVVAGFAIYIAVQPSNYDLSRNAEINAPSAIVHHYVDDYTKRPQWDPWFEQEPDAQVTYGDKTSGVGASYSWKGEELGEGSMETIYVSEDSIARALKFIKPYESSADVYWNIEARENTTKVNWGMKGEMGFMDKVFITLGGGMDKMIGPQYERGLKKLDSMITADMKRYAVSNDGVTEHSGGHYLYLKTTCTMDEMGEKMKAMFSELHTFIQSNNIEMAGKSFTRYAKWDEEAGTTTFLACLPVKEEVMLPQESNVLYAHMESYKYHKTTLKGDYANLKEAWEKATEDAGEPSGDEQMQGKYPLEVYVTGPMETPNPAEWITEIYIPVNQ